jgi:hypothetical protein
MDISIPALISQSSNRPLGIAAATELTITVLQRSPALGRSADRGSMSQSEALLRPDVRDRRNT